MFPAFVRGFPRVCLLPPGGRGRRGRPEAAARGVPPPPRPADGRDPTGADRQRSPQRQEAPAAWR